MSNYVNLLDIGYPVGSVFISNNSVSPADSIGGTWTKLDSDTFICNGTPAATGGANERKLSIVNLPSNVWLTGGTCDSFGLTKTCLLYLIQEAYMALKHGVLLITQMNNILTNRLTIVQSIGLLTSISAQLNLFEGNFMFPSFFYGQIPKIKRKLFSYYIDYVEKKGYCREWMLCRNWYRNTLSGLSLC